jgi:hypothetical protein
MAYVERGGPPHFDGKGYHKWAARMMIFLRGKLLDFIVLDKTYAVPAEIHTLMVTDPGAKAKYEANAKAVGHLVRSLCDPEFECVRHLNLAWQIRVKLLVAHGGDNHVKAHLFVSYRMQYENFTQLPSEDIDAMFQRFTAIVNNMKANVEDFPYTEHDQALKLLHILDPNVWGAKVEAIKESGQYLTIELDDLFYKLKSAEVDRKLQSKHEGSTDHSLALMGGSKGKANPSCRQFSLSSLMSILDEEFDVLGEEELALLSRRFDRLHENRINARRSSGTCYKCGKRGHFIAECPEEEENKYKMNEYKAHPRREDKYSSKGKNFSKSKSKDKDKR